jgi:hypothetical protein
MHRSNPGRTPALRVGALAICGFLLGTLACGSKTVDARCRIDAGRHTEQIAKSVAGARLWRVYFDKMTATAPLIDLTIDVQRRTRKTYGGDYDSGSVTIVFEARSLKHDRRLLQKEGTFEIDTLLIGRFDKNVTREQMQEIAFIDAEKEAYPFLDQWVKLAAIKAMALEGGQGKPFIPVLEKLLDDQWTPGEMRGATESALTRIRRKA